MSDQIPDVEDLHDISIDHCTGYLVQTRSGGMMIAHYIRVFGDAYFECRTLPIRDVVAWMPRQSRIEETEVSDYETN